MTTMTPQTEPNSGEPEKLPSWAIPPQSGFTSEDLDRIPELPNHTELIDGSLIFVSPQADFHTLAIDLFTQVLRQFAPAHLRVRREMSVILGRRQRPEPNVVVLKASAIKGTEKTAYHADDVVLAVEVVSPESELRDRVRKPQIYAASGIPHFWRVEQENPMSRLPVVYTYELDPATGTYAHAGVHHKRLKVSTPYEIDVDLADIELL